MLDAALDLLGEAGIRALTHGAVDRHGGLPPGTASNYFRTRDALLSGVLEHLARRELRLIASLGTDQHSGSSVASLVDEAASMVAFLLGPGRTQTLARHAIFLEAAWRPELRPSLLAATVPFWELLADRLTSIGAPTPQAAARTLLSCIDGVIIDQLIRPQQDFDARSTLEPLVTALAGSVSETLDSR
ncbi:TetR/AcrR family transcriptional regulator [Modestobacter altitudinis]|uniref:TetR/AcrR family transcriptional regulator n=1 Tax=Modestobacter altitudinis TaxID=2213158 RepID=UPI0014866A79|nr:TetR/AcrR family transcriptional regulator [Modestobacter altitudinis]